jgi:hypothetical protein
LEPECSKNVDAVHIIQYDADIGLDIVHKYWNTLVCMIGQGQRKQERKSTARPTLSALHILEPHAVAFAALINAIAPRRTSICHFGRRLSLAMVTLIQKRGLTGPNTYSTGDSPDSLWVVFQFGGKLFPPLEWHLRHHICRRDLPLSTSTLSSKSALKVPVS